MLSNDTHLLSKTQLLYLQELGINKPSKDKGKARNQLLKKLKTISTEDFIDLWDLEEEQSHTEEQSKAIKFSDNIPEDYETNIKFQSIQIEIIIDYLLVLHKLIYKVDIKRRVQNIESGIVKQDKSVKDFFNFRAINFINFQNYNSNFFNTMEEIVVFEYLLMLDEYFKEKYNLKKFYHTKKQFKDKIGIKASKLNSILAKFEKLGFITLTKEGIPCKMHFKLHIPIIANSLSQILISCKKT